jgi:tetratricopeptide (TPR) repeat protein
MNSWVRAEHLARAGNHAKALELVQDRYRPEWNNADRGAFVAYLKARGGVLGVDEGIQMLEACSKAVMENPDELKFRFYRAWVYKCLGRENAALMDFVEVAREDPSNVDAARELHLARKRRRSAVSSSGLMDRIRRSLTPAPRERQEMVITSHPTARARPK